uniref:Uncharacterized protein n=1 Tax=Ralstonia solanacearum TaxID=305 RepID=A0A0S4UPX7_RALSL|nr:protein of unknown function [Ralstonia solanacearum]CUV34343.1 protein of unknown function [Ralstonia solanacearum]CUV40708.1 protein of unknown function [Ralstonia solanacearum]CUV60615.1 protein of unknown function [Ralstonia solanacearum]
MTPLWALARPQATASAEAAVKRTDTRWALHCRRDVLALMLMTSVSSIWQVSRLRYGGDELSPIFLCARMRWQIAGATSLATLARLPCVGRQGC